MIANNILSGFVYAKYVRYAKIKVRWTNIIGHSMESSVRYARADWCLICTRILPGQCVDRSGLPERCHLTRGALNLKFWQLGLYWFWYGCWQIGKFKVGCVSPSWRAGAAKWATWPAACVRLCQVWWLEKPFEQLIPVWCFSIAHESNTNFIKKTI